MNIPTLRQHLLTGSIATVALATTLVTSTAQAAKPTDMSDIVGIWHNVNQNPLTSGIVDLTVTQTSAGIVKVEAVQACGNPVCLLGTTTATTYSFDSSSNVAESWTAKFNSTASLVQLAATRLPTASPAPEELMQVLIFTKYPRSDARDSFVQTAIFQRVIDPPPSP